MNEKIRSIADLHESLHNTFIYDENYIFRGQANDTWKIRPTLLRHECSKVFKLKTIENSCFKSLERNLDIPYLRTYNSIEYLSILQHFNYPTRLLDLTYDPLVALFFACYSKNEIDFNSDGVFYGVNSEIFEQHDLRKNPAPIFDKHFENIDQANFWKMIDVETLIFIKQSFGNIRLRNQHGCFLLFPFATINTNDEQYPSLEDFLHWGNRKLCELNNDDGLYCFMVKKPIDAKYKRKILEELELIYGISYETLFPEIDNQIVTKFREMIYASIPPI